MAYVLFAFILGVAIGLTVAVVCFRRLLSAIEEKDINLDRLLERQTKHQGGAK